MFLFTPCSFPPPQSEEKPTKELVVKKLEEMGHRIGERLVERISRDTPRFKNELDAVIFICKTFWLHAFNKQVDNLKTNHQVRNLPSYLIPKTPPHVYRKTTCYM